MGKKKADFIGAQHELRRLIKALTDARFDGDEEETRIILRELKDVLRAIEGFNPAELCMDTSKLESIIDHLLYGEPEKLLCGKLCDWMNFDKAINKLNSHVGVLAKREKRGRSKDSSKVLAALAELTEILPREDRKKLRGECQLLISHLKITEKLDVSNSNAADLKNSLLLVSRYIETEHDTSKILMIKKWIDGISVRYASIRKIRAIAKQNG